jgi:biotin transport system permease protein
MAAMVISGVIVSAWWFTLSLLAISVILVLLTAVPPRFGLQMSWALILVAVLLVAYQSFTGKPLTGVVIAGNLIMAVYASRMLTISTPESVLIDALISAASFLRVFRVKPEKVGLAISIMIKSIPMLLDLFTGIQQAAMARGRGRNLAAIVTPFVVRTVAYAQETGAALAARGLGE